MTRKIRQIIEELMDMLGKRENTENEELLERASKIIKNAWRENWEQATPEWKDDAKKWDEDYHDLLKKESE